MKFAHQLDRIVQESEKDYANQYVAYRNLKKDLRTKNKKKARVRSHNSLVLEGDLSNPSTVPAFAEEEQRESSPKLESMPSTQASGRKETTMLPLETKEKEGQRVSGDVSEENVEEIVRNENKNVFQDEQLAENIVNIDPKDAAFFIHLDEELEKVNRFFLPRARALLERYEYLEKQDSKSKFFKSLKEKLFSSRFRKNDEPADKRLVSSDVRTCNGTTHTTNYNAHQEEMNLVASSQKMQDSIDYIQRLSSTAEVYKEALRLLQYVNVNITAFRKILKKHDKLCDLSVGKQYLRLKVESQPFVHSSLAKSLEELGCRGSIVVSLVQKRPAVLSDIGEYQCPICISLLYKPMALPCGHKFCGKCISRAILLDFHCPVCRRDYSNGVCLQRKKSLERFLRETFPQAWQKRKEEVLQDEKERILSNTQALNRPRVTLSSNNSNREYADNCRLS
jgi:SPX domain protein involved in polyphosphate accumulation